MTEREIEAAIRAEERALDAEHQSKMEAAAEERRKQIEAYKERTVPPPLYDATIDGYEVRPYVHPRILAQVNGLVQVLRWNPILARYLYGDRSQYGVHPDDIRFWLPFPEGVNPPEGFYG